MLNGPISRYLHVLTFSAARPLHTNLVTTAHTTRTPSLSHSAPQTQVVRDYIASYSPLHNLDPQRAADYPALLLTASLHDTRVNFW